ncbi:hypothetical protein QZH41_017313 [Actinostola sp. cb2023]|nr:hypothetical protein QZH41_017313 [Actinostola sp. cb2023]
MEIVPELSMIIHEVLNDIYNRFHHLLEDLDQNWIDAPSFAYAIHSAGAPLQNCWGFIDGILRPCCRPIHNQRILFSDITSGRLDLLVPVLAVIGNQNGVG